MVIATIFEVCLHILQCVLRAFAGFDLLYFIQIIIVNLMIDFIDYFSMLVFYRVVFGQVTTLVRTVDAVEPVVSSLTVQKTRRTYDLRITEAIPNKPYFATFSWENWRPENPGSNSKQTIFCDYLKGELSTRESWKQFQTNRILRLSRGRTGDPRIPEAFPNKPYFVTILRENLRPENHGSNSKQTIFCELSQGKLSTCRIHGSSSNKPYLQTLSRRTLTKDPGLFQTNPELAQNHGQFQTNRILWTSRGGTCDLRIKGELDENLKHSNRILRLSRGRTGDPRIMETIQTTIFVTSQENDPRIMKQFQTNRILDFLWEKARRSSGNSNKPFVTSQGELDLRNQAEIQTPFWTFSWETCDSDHGNTINHILPQENFVTADHEKQFQPC
ncbi:hypothetical protein NPIL_245031 [Nephila pilipes]|uniref:Uncharacterized protein n=1 Tax=Nephila pilipes TaxID=299642 RepID=A0A8X6NX40_NEPPI|nr:hypothetical protein NPIL_245031 [Nephila pilipes]